jgi:hypothetical protein
MLQTKERIQSPALSVISTMLNDIAVHGADYRNFSEEHIVQIIKLTAWTFEPDQDRAEKQAAATLNHWVENGLPFRLDANGGRLFDPVELWDFGVHLPPLPGDRSFGERYVAVNRKSWTSRLLLRLVTSRMAGARIRSSFIALFISRE